jgi:hypothetical protein
VVKIEIEQKIVWCVWLKECFSNWGYKIYIYIYIYIYILILMVFNLNIVDLTITITSWNK